MSGNGFNVVAACPDLAVLRVSGADNLRFLQAQLSNDVEGLASNATCKAAWCDPKGRVLALFQICKHLDDVLLIAPRAVIDTHLKRLRLFVLRAKVSLDVDESCSVIGIAGGSAEAWLLKQIHTTDADVSWQETRGAIRLQGEQRWLLLVESSDVEALMESAGLTSECAIDTWYAAAIDAGEPTVVTETSGEFVPQMLNLELLDGISFSKGCYPGQEIVARTQYLGRIKRRMYALLSADSEVPSPGTSITDSNAKTIGKVVYAATADRQASMLAVLRVDAAAAGNLQLPDGSKLEVATLPYEIPVAEVPTPTA